MSEASKFKDAMNALVYHRAVRAGILGSSLLVNAACGNPADPVWRIGVACDSKASPVIVGSEFDAKNTNLMLDIACRDEAGNKVRPSGVVTLDGPGIKGDIGLSPNHEISFSYVDAYGTTGLKTEQQDDHTRATVQNVFDVGDIAISRIAKNA